MYTNVGKKIKTLAKVLAWIGIIASVIGGIVMMTAGVNITDFSGRTSSASGVVPGLIMMVVGAVGSWLGSLCLYGFGELVDKVTAIAENNSRFS